MREREGFKAAPVTAPLQAQANALVGSEIAVVEADGSDSED